jgi:hypothetical protein
VLALHDDQLRLFGGSAGVRDRGALESAVATPEATFDDEFLHEDLFQMAAAYAFHIAENQPFVDGNKRTGLNAALVFLDVNGWVVLDPDMPPVCSRRRSRVRSAGAAEAGHVRRTLTRGANVARLTLCLAQCGTADARLNGLGLDFAGTQYALLSDPCGCEL